jgi:carboxylate-amine ligase
VALQLGCQTGVVRTVGVEEEFLLVDAHHDGLAPVASRVLRIAAARGDAGSEGDGAGSLVLEFQEQQLEAYTSPHTSMSMLEEELRSWRAKASSAAAEAGARVVASATSPIVVEPRQVRTPRYDRITERFGLNTTEQLTCGCHVHVAVTSAEEAIGVLDRIRVWLPTLLALSANSPFWQGHDTSYASFRTQVMSRWPVSGPTDVFGSFERYREIVAGLLAADVILDEGMLYFDARPSHQYPTVEVRVPDVCLDVRDTVLIAALCRALVETSAQEWFAGDQPQPTPTALLRLATWRAARWGIDERLLDPLTSRPLPADDVVARLLDHVRPVLGHSEDEALVTEGIERLFMRGNGATRQREILEKTGQVTDVIVALAQATEGHNDDRVPREHGC